VLAVLFPGQGSQRPGMGTAWRNHPSWSVVEQVSAATGRDVAALLVDADAETLTATRNAQLAAYTLSLVIADATGVLGGSDRTPIGAAAGHSLGEYTALVVAGALTIADGARLVAERGEAMQAASEQAPGTMAAVLGLDVDQVIAACAGVEEGWMANDNAPGQVVIAGTRQGVSAASDRAMEAGAKRVMGLPVGGAFHSPLMASAQKRLDAALAAAYFEPVATAVVANVDATAHQEGFTELLSAQLCSPVRWRESLLALAALGADRFCELGPGTELSGMVKRTVSGAARANVATPADVDTAAGVLGG
jgi:[acyl-carrier-protein] S-malonyltransferase